MKAEEIKILLKDIYCSASRVFRDKLIASILFGSYARGDYDSESDMDIALIVSCKRNVEADNAVRGTCEFYGDSGRRI